MTHHILERDVQRAVLALLHIHPKVSFAFRQNSGQMQRGDRKVRFAFKGCSDVLGMLTDGRFLAVEIKRPGGKPTPAQQAFIDNVNRHGGLGLVVSSVQEIDEALKKPSMRVILH